FPVLLQLYKAGLASIRLTYHLPGHESSFDRKESGCFRIAELHIAFESSRSTSRLSFAHRRRQYQRRTWFGERVMLYSPAMNWSNVCASTICLTKTLFFRGHANIRSRASSGVAVLRVAVRA